MHLPLLCSLLLQGPPSASPEQKEVFALLDALDPLDTGKLPFVLVATGKWHKPGNEPPQNVYRHAFLLGSDARGFRVRYLDLGEEAFVATPRGTPEHRRVGFVPADLRDVVADVLERMRSGRPLHDDDFPPSGLEPELAPPTLALLLARACARCGRTREVELLWNALPDLTTRDGLLGSDSGLARLLADRLVLAFADRSLSWSDLLARHDLWLARFENARGWADVRKRRDAVKALVAGEKGPASRAGSTSARELVAGLRDEARLVPREFRGSVLAYLSEPGRERASPLDRVVRQGLAAVPALIALLEDESPTRSVDFVTRFGTSYAVQPLRELAEEALVLISGRDLSGHGSAAAWRAWHARVSEKGLRAELDARLRAGGNDACEAALAWLACWPDDQEALLRVLADQGVNAPYRLTPLWALASASRGKPNPHLDKALEDELLAATDAGTRVRVARMLLERGRRSGVAPVLSSWRSLVASGASDDRTRATLEELAGSLLESGDPGAWEAVAGSLQARAARIAFAECLRKSVWSDVLDRVEPKDRAAIDACLRRAMLGLLDDRLPFTKDAVVMVGRKRVVMHDASLADVAAHLLASRWPEEFRFDPAGDRDAREDRITTLCTRRGASTAISPGAGSSRIRSVRVDDSAAALPADLQRRLSAVIGTDIEPRWAIELIVEIAGSAAAKGKAASLRCVRVGDGTGFSVVVELREGTPRHAELSLRTSVGGEPPALTTTTADRLSDPGGAWLTEVRARIARALRSEARDGVEIQLSLQRP